MLIVLSLCMLDAHTKIADISICEWEQKIVELEGRLESALQCLPLPKTNYSISLHGTAYCHWVFQT